MKTLIPYSRHAVEYTDTLKDIPNPYIVISVNEPTFPDVNLNTNENCKGILRLQFHDLSSELTDGQENLEVVLFDDAMARKVLNFVFEHKDIDYIITHCMAGICRSPAIAAALSVIFNGKDEYFFTHFVPNRLVYRTILKVYYAEYGPKT
jgi:predicted protein tyrosine phosphatase